MKIIEKLSNFIEEEIDDSEKYIRCAILYKEDNPALANVFYTMSLDEAKHMNLLHDEVVRLINQYRNEHGNPPESMQAVYDYLHEKHTTRYSSVKAMQIQYKE